jgi:protein-tyrosine phosphatase
MPKRVLFLCTGNYYRSRFAEELFNHHARRLGLDWAADSRALAIERGHENVGPISRHAAAALAARDVLLAEPARRPAACEANDLEAADLVVAVKEAEHRAYLRQKFPAWEDRVTYWHVHDLDAATPDEALAMLERLVGELVSRCRSGAA